jgi:hypothetical protein
MGIDCFRVCSLNELGADAENEGEFLQVGGCRQFVQRTR